MGCQDDARSAGWFTNCRGILSTASGAADRRISLNRSSDPDLHGHVKGPRRNRFLLDSIICAVGSRLNFILLSESACSPVVHVTADGRVVCDRTAAQTAGTEL
jgi:hypothetical protein